MRAWTDGQFAGLLIKARFCHDQTDALRSTVSGSVGAYGQFGEARRCGSTYRRRMVALNLQPSSPTRFPSVLHANPNAWLIECDPPRVPAACNDALCHGTDRLVSLTGHDDAGVKHPGLIRSAEPRRRFRRRCRHPEPPNCQAPVQWRPGGDWGPEVRFWQRGQVYGRRFLLPIRHRPPAEIILEGPVGRWRRCPDPASAPGMRRVAIARLGTARATVARAADPGGGSWRVRADPPRRSWHTAGIILRRFFETESG